MEGYISEEQQVEAIKKWWKENGMAVAAGAILGLGILFGGRAWFDYRQTQREEASMNYTLLLQAAEAGNGEDARRLGERLVAEGSGDYPAMASLMLARLAQERGEGDAAASHLQWVIDNGRLPGLKSVATLRMARLRVLQGDRDGALALLAAGPAPGFAAAYAELEGDIHTASGNREAARNAYSVALAAGSGPNPLLQMKHDDLIGGGE